MTSYTFSSTIIYIPLSASLCAATSATENVFDILSSFLYLFLFLFNLYRLWDWQIKLIKRSAKMNRWQETQIIMAQKSID